MPLAPQETNDPAQNPESCQEKHEVKAAIQDQDDDEIYKTAVHDTILQINLWLLLLAWMASHVKRPS